LQLPALRNFRLAPQKRASRAHTPRRSSLRPVLTRVFIGSFALGFITACERIGASASFTRSGSLAPLDQAACLLQLFV